MYQYVIIESKHKHVAVRWEGSCIKIIPYDRNPFNTKVITFSRDQALILAKIITKGVSHDQ
jgi:hypothetical protein